MTCDYLGSSISFTSHFHFCLYSTRTGCNDLHVAYTNEPENQVSGWQQHTVGLKQLVDWNSASSSEEGYWPISNGQL